MGSAGAGGGTRSSMTAPGSTNVFALTAWPSLVRPPSEISRWTWLRDNPLRSAAHRSARPRRPSDGTAIRRMSGAAVLAAGAVISSGTVRYPAGDRGPQAGGQQQQDREADARVGDVERV